MAKLEAKLIRKMGKLGTDLRGKIVKLATSLQAEIGKEADSLRLELRGLEYAATLATFSVSVVVLMSRLIR